MKFFKVIALSALVVSVGACKKDPGPGGMGTIKGKLIYRDYDASFTQLKAEYPAQGENVYICYEGMEGVGSSVKSSYDGTFIFTYLRKGKYKVFAVGKDSTSQNSSKTAAAIQNVEITDKKQTVEVPDLIILD